MPQHNSIVPTQRPLTGNNALSSGSHLGDLLRDSQKSLGFSPSRLEASEYIERLKEHLSGDRPSERLARVLGRWRKFPFVVAMDGRPCESGLAAFVMHVRQIFDAIDEDDQDLGNQIDREHARERDPDSSISRPIRCQKEGWLTIREVAEILDCSYTQARERMLDGRIKTYKDKKHIRTKREWVDEYIDEQIVREPNSQPEVKLGRQRRAKKERVKPQGIGLKFLKNRKS